MGNKRKTTATAIILADKFISEQAKSIVQEIKIPLLEHIIIQLTRVFSKVLINSDNSTKYRSLSLPVIPDLVKGVGNIMGIISCLEASLTDLNFFISSSTPELEDDFVTDMLTHGLIYDAVIPYHPDKTIEPLFGIYKKSNLPLIRKAIDEGETAFPGVLKYLNVKYFSLEGQKWFVNIGKMENPAKYLAQFRKS